MPPGWSYGENSVDPLCRKRNGSIVPKIDTYFSIQYSFKSMIYKTSIIIAVLGLPNLLVHFLNAVLVDDLASPITEAEILNPYNDKEFLDDKLSVVDVKAKDGEGRLYQIEIQLLAYRHLPERMVLHLVRHHQPAIAKRP